MNRVLAYFRRPSQYLMLERSLAVLTLGGALWIFATFLPSGVRAELPVIDTSAIAQMIQQYSQMAQQLSTLVQQVGLMKQQIASATGHYGMGAIGAEINPWGGTSWSDIAAMVGQGINPGDGAQVQAYKQAQATYAAQFPALSPALQTTNPRMNAAYTQTYSDGVTGAALGESTFNQVGTTLADVQSLKDQIELTPNLKSAIDLNTSVIVRIAQINSEILRVQSAQLRLQSSNQTQNANGAAAQTEFFAQE